jgi:hypothetical protein
MKNIVIPVDKSTDVKFILELVKRLGLKPKVVESTSKPMKPMNWKLMPEDEDELEAQIIQAKKDIKAGKYYTSRQVKEIVSKWK